MDTPLIIINIIFTIVAAFQIHWLATSKIPALYAISGMAGWSMSVLFIWVGSLT